MKYICPVCGFDELDEPAYKGDIGSQEICSCCDYQFGKTDDDEHISHEEWRQQWILRGMPWSTPSERPANWNPVKQLRNVNH